MDGTNSELTDSEPIENSTDMFGGLPETKSDTGNYRVLARKYRPQNFNDLYGQDAMVQTLSNAFETGRIAQAWMLTGVRGVGKTTTARILARALNYELPGKIEKPTIKLDEMGAHCQAIMEGRHIDVIEMDAASHTGINDIREITDAARYSPASARYKVYIIDEVHMLSNAAFNGLLKTLEEPPEHVKFIFATTEIRKVPVTVLSRCQRFDLRRIDSSVLVKLMREISDAESIDISEEALSIIARAGEGSARDSLSLLDQAISHGSGHIDAENVRMMLGLSDRTKVIDMFEQIMNGNPSEALENLQSQYNAGADPVIVVSDLAEFVHLVTRMKIAPDSVLSAAISEAERTRGLEFSKKLSLGILSRAWQILLKGIPEVQFAPNPLAAADMILVRLCYSADLPSPEDTLKSLRSGKIPEITANAKAQTDSQGSVPTDQKNETERATSDQGAENSKEPPNSAIDSETGVTPESEAKKETEKETNPESSKNSVQTDSDAKETIDQTTASESSENQVKEDSSSTSAESNGANTAEEVQTAERKDAAASESPDQDLEKPSESSSAASDSETGIAPESESEKKNETEQETGTESMENSEQTDSDAKETIDQSPESESSVESTEVPDSSTNLREEDWTGASGETHSTNQISQNEIQSEFSLKSLEDVAKLASERRDIKLKLFIETQVRPVSFEPGRIEFQSTDKLPFDFAKDLGRKLKEWTGETWEIVSSQQEGSPTIREKSEIEQQSKFDAAEKIPAVSEILKTWPGAKITSVKSKDPTEETSRTENEDQTEESMV